jgi:hypothetical protein
MGIGRMAGARRERPTGGDGGELSRALLPPLLARTLGGLEAASTVQDPGAVSASSPSSYSASPRARVELTVSTTL